MRKKIVSMLLCFAIFETFRFSNFLYIRNLSRNNRFGKILWNMTKLMKHKFLTSKCKFLTSKHLFLTSNVHLKCKFLTSKCKFFTSSTFLASKRSFRVSRKTKHRHFRYLKPERNYGVKIGSKFLRKNRFDSVFNWIIHYVHGSHCFTTQIPIHSQFVVLIYVFVLPVLDLCFSIKLSEK